MCVFGHTETGGAWLSSARVVRCWVKSRNERNPYPSVEWGANDPCSRSCQAFPIKGQIVKVFDFAVSTQLCPCSTKTATDSTVGNNHGCGPVKLDLQK